MDTYPRAQHPFKKFNFGNSSEKRRKCKYQTFFSLSNINGFIYFVPNTLSVNVGRPISYFDLTPPPLLDFPVKLLSMFSHRIQTTCFFQTHQFCRHESGTHPVYHKKVETFGFPIHSGDHKNIGTLLIHTYIGTLLIHT